MREVIKETTVNGRTLQLLGGSAYTVRGISNDNKVIDKDFPLSRYNLAKEFYGSIKHALPQYK